LGFVEKVVENVGETKLKNCEKLRNYRNFLDIFCKLRKLWKSQNK